MKLIHYENACREIALANTIDEAKDWTDKAEALRAYARQAHNTEMEVQVAEIKLRALRRMGELSKALEKAKNDTALPINGKSKSEQLYDAGVSTSAAHRAEQVAEIPEDVFEQRLAEYRDTQTPVTQAKITKPHVAQNSGENEWYTPPDIIQSALSVMGRIDLDPASTEIANKTVGAAEYYTKTENGLEQKWRGNIWLNPPYSQPLIRHFSDKVCKTAVSHDYHMMTLVNNATETEWFQNMARLANAICFISKRVKFLDPDGNPGAPLQGQAILYFGPAVLDFTAVFSVHGAVLKHA